MASLSRVERLTDFSVECRQYIDFLYTNPVFHIEFVRSENRISRSKAPGNMGAQQQIKTSGRRADLSLRQEILRDSQSSVRSAVLLEGAHQSVFSSR